MSAVNNVLDQMVQEGNRMMRDMEYVQNFDFDNATEDELADFESFLERRICRIKQVKAEVEKVQQALK